MKKYILLVDICTTYDETDSNLETDFTQSIESPVECEPDDLYKRIGLVKTRAKNLVEEQMDRPGSVSVSIKQVVVVG